MPVRRDTGTMPAHPAQLAHLAEIVEPVSSGPAIALTLFAAGLLGGLISLDHRVKGNTVGPPRGRRRLALIAIGALVLGAAPSATGTSQGEIPAGLPDLVSDPSYIWFNKLITDDSGAIRKVMAFDGYIHNIGDGPLEMYGNPQVPGGVRQRVWTGQEWETLDDPAPLVIFETTDGHEHFHLMAAAEYELWDVTQTVKIGDSAKVGFCLVDTEQRDERYDAFYSITTYRYCEQYHPGSTELRMGITPGWTDTYDANTTLQWVDISEIEPGYYWVGAITDPDDQVVESDETNNGLVFSANRFAATGYIAADIAPHMADQEITLAAHSYGRVGEVRFRIEEGPANGTLSVPVGVDLTAATVVYTPNPGFDGTDTFSYSASDVDSLFPLNPAVVSVHVEVSDAAAEAAAASPGAAADLTGRIQIESIQGRMYEPIEAAARIANGDGGREGGGEGLSWYGDNLPAGLTIDPTSGTITGVPTEYGQGIARIVAMTDGGAETEAELSWEVESVPLPEFTAVNDFASPAEEKINVYFGLGTEGATYSATGLPEGTRIGDRLPLLAGHPIELGTFDVVVQESIDGKVVATAEFQWTVLPLPVPRFPL